MISEKQLNNFATLQVTLVNAEHNPQLMLLAARNITLLADVIPAICSSIVRHGAVPALCARLMTIEYIDLAEQSLQVCATTQHLLVVVKCAIHSNSMGHTTTHPCTLESPEVCKYQQGSL